ncbi:hypothetical protein [Hoeflea alexandrii]|uniref:hypothetical protein n=1 Tax=Hoeflea alexandrii TaxID=288436 RepID=UPI0022AE70B0|nr:hypothetical protein [Hoeflea alexandrii]
MKSSVFGIFGRAAGRSGYLARLFCLMSTLALVAGCTKPVMREYANAVGSDLHDSSTTKNTRYLELYSSHLCYQASLPMTEPGSFTKHVCDFGKFKSNEWKSFVDMGVYDIDRRCDAFLESLYYRDKTRGPILEQINDSRSLTRGILEIVVPGSRAISIVAATFDFAESTFLNARDGLLQALDQTTVKSLVYGRQNTLKKEIAEITFTSKPQALSALRAYLRVCMPFTIEMEANAVLTTVQRNNGNAGNSLIEAMVGISQLKNSESKVDTSDRDDTDKNVEFVKGFAPGTVEDKIRLATGREIQDMLCMERTNLNDGNFSITPMRDRMLEFETGLYLGDQNKTEPDSKINSDAEFKMYKRASDLFGVCGKSNHISAFEAGYFSVEGKAKSFKSKMCGVLRKSSKEDVKNQFEKLDVTKLKDRNFNKETRTAIGLVSKELGLSDGNRLTADIITKLAAIPVLPEAPCI